MLGIPPRLIVRSYYTPFSTSKAAIDSSIATGHLLGSEIEKPLPMPAHRPIRTLAVMTLAYSKGDVVKGAAATAQQHGVVLRSVAEYASGFGHGYTNPYVAVHRKAKIFKDHAREENKNDAELRKSRLVQELGEIRDEEPD